jgi:hypothetical protein
MGPFGFTSHPKEGVLRIFHHHVAIKELGYLLTRSGLTRPDVSSYVFFDSFWLLGCSFYQSG